MGGHYMKYQDLAFKINSLLFGGDEFVDSEDAEAVRRVISKNIWVSVDEKPLADITIERDGMTTTATYDNYLVGVDMLFAVPIGNGEYSICRGYIDDDGSIQESFQSGENEWWGYSLEDVTHYMQIFNPEIN